MRCICCPREAKENRKLCQSCIDYRINYNKTHKKQRLEASRKYRETHDLHKYYHDRFIEVKIKIINHYSKGKMCCSCCGEKILEFLTVDHLNNDGTKHRKKIGVKNGKGFYDWIIKNNYPEIFQILCWNCNWAKWRYKICPHKELSLW